MKVVKIRLISDRISSNFLLDFLLCNLKNTYLKTNIGDTTLIFMYYYLFITNIF